MGSIAKVVKKASRVIKKPISKITKGIARGIAKVGKSVMKGVGRLSKKLGPLGMIALSVAMPYALGGLSTAIGHGGMAAGQASGWLGSQNVFLRSIGTVGNAIRTGYTATTGAIGRTWSTITKSISKGFQNFSGGKGNIWTRISNGTKNLFNSARNTMKKYTPKFRPGTPGSVEVAGFGGPAGGASTGGNYLGMGTRMTTDQYAALLKSDAGLVTQHANLAEAMSPLSNQKLGSAEGWFTKAGSSEADKLVTQTINNASNNNISKLTGDSLRHYNDIKSHAIANNSYVNNQEIFNQVVNNKGTSYQGITDFDGVYNSDLGMTGDYKLVNPNEPTSYQFTGDNTYNNNVGKSSIKKPSKIKKGMKYAAGQLSKGLLAPTSFKHPDVMYASAADMTAQTTGGYGGTDIQGSWGGSLLQGAFDDNQRERIMNFYKNMNIIGSH